MVQDSTREEEEKREETKIEHRVTKRLRRNQEPSPQRHSHRAKFTREREAGREEAQALGWRSLG